MASRAAVTEPSFWVRAAILCDQVTVMGTPSVAAALTGISSVRGYPVGDTEALFRAHLFVSLIARRASGAFDITVTLIAPGGRVLGRHAAAQPGAQPGQTVEHVFVIEAAVPGPGLYEVVVLAGREEVARVPLEFIPFEPPRRRQAIN